MSTPAPLTILDTETDGVHPGRQAWEVAMIRREPDGTERELAFFMEIDLSTADPFGLQIGGFYDRHPLGRFLSNRSATNKVPRDTGNYLTRKAAAFAVAQWTHGAHIVGAIPSFDTFTLDPLLRSQGLIPSWHYHIIDVEALVVGWLNGRASVLEYDNADTSRLRVRPPYKSDDLAALLGLDPIPEEDRHTALGDARFARAMYDDVTCGARARDLTGARA